MDKLDELKQHVLERSRDAESWIDSDIASQRTKAQRYYNGEKFGNEEAGRSQVVVTEVRDTVNAVLPSLMRIFFGGEKVVEFMPMGPEDIEVAEQATDYVNYIVQKDNPGFQIFYGAFKDALKSKTGIVKYWWDEVISVTTHEFSGLTEQALAALLSEEGVEVVSHDKYPDPTAPTVLMDETGNTVLDQMGQPIPAPPVFLFDVVVKRTKKKKKVSLCAVPPEEFLINRDARYEDIQTWNHVEHRSEKTKSDLVSLGYDPDTIDFAAERTLEFNKERQARNPNSHGLTGEKKVIYREVWTRYDLDEDGIDELLRVCIAGKELLHVEPTDDIPFAVFCPDPEPHAFFGLSEADKVMDIQEQKSFVLRNIFDSLAQSIHNRMEAVEGQVNMGDLLNNEVGGVVRVRAPGMLRQLDTPFVGQQAFPVMAYLDEMKENRTGRSKASAGLDAGALQSSTRAAVAQTIAAANERTEMIARIFAEGGMKRAFTGILKLICRHQDKARVIRLRNQWVEMDPRSWDATMDVSVNVALGAGTTEDRLNFLNLVASKQEAVLQLAGMDNPIVSPSNYYNTLSKMVEIQGYKDPNLFWTDPQTWEPPPPKPDPAEMLAQLQMEDIRGKLAIDTEKLRLEREKSAWEQDFKRDELDADIILRTKEMEMKYKESVDIATIKANVDKVRKDTPSVVVNERPKRTRKVPIRDASGEIVAVDEVPVED